MLGHRHVGCADLWRGFFKPATSRRSTRGQSFTGTEESRDHSFGLFSLEFPRALFHANSLPGGQLPLFEMGPTKDPEKSLRKQKCKAHVLKLGH
ncbi:hypothetical protein AVEN_189545-1 [Araneus ventricosus]|uniref:Uncharacterized protein n=1 Tax=Araneus ventricosus TaxID=182803 RepID=A0A4Y2R2M7_ARAVE|nr:hypothetical protein AVEN_189545-1 [Araneus ventricosus]